MLDLLLSATQDIKTNPLKVRSLRRALVVFLTSPGPLFK